jgi:hypothetical protein
MIGRLKGVSIHKQPPWVKRRACEALPSASLNARPRMAGQVVLVRHMLRQGRSLMSIESERLS